MIAFWYNLEILIIEILSADTLSSLFMSLPFAFTGCPRDLGTKSSTSSCRACSGNYHVV